MSAKLLKFSLSVVLAGLLHGNALADNINYILATRQTNLMKNMDRVADMVANVNTTAFKAENDIFTEKAKRTSSNEKISFATIGKTVRDNSSGGMATTSKQLDVAISGEGYFMLITPFGQMFTRNGSFMVSRDGLLVNQDGYVISGPSGGQIELTEKDVDISIKEDGLVKAGTEERGQIGVFKFDDNSALVRVGKGLFTTTQTAKLADNFQLAQGMLENSNVNSITAMTDLVAVSRNFENVTKLTAVHDEAQLDMIKKMSQ